MVIAEVNSILAGGTHFVRITTDDGTTGLGQSAAWAYPEAVDAVVRRFAPALVGQDPGRIEHHWHHLYRMGPFRGSVLMAAISAVDLALWDIKGKRLGAPVWELLGGRCRDRVRLYLIIGGETPEQLAEAARSAVAEGFTAVKIDALPSDYLDVALPRLIAGAVERAAAVREAVGEDVDLILELHRRLSPTQFPSLARRLREFAPLFVEDPIQIDSIAAQAEMARAVDVPIGLGERLHTSWEFRELLAAGGAQFVRPDPGLAGGITGCRKIAAVAEAHHAIVCTHNFLGPLLTAASVHLDVAIPNFAVQEYCMVDESDYARAFRGRLEREGGWLPVPEAPGLGIELDESAVVSLWPEGYDPTSIALRRDGSIGLAV